MALFFNVFCIFVTARRRTERLSADCYTDQDRALYGLYYCELWSSKCAVIPRQIIEYGLGHIFYRFHFTLYGAVHLYDITDLGREQIPLP